MKKPAISLAIIWLFLAILTATGCAASEPGYTTVFSGDGNVTLTVPSDWNTNDTNIIPASIIGVSKEANHEYVIVAGQSQSSLGANSTINDYLALLQKSSVTTIGNGVWGDPSKVTINDLDGLAVRVTGIWKKDNTDSTFFFNVLANNNYYYTVVSFTDTSLVAANEPTLQKIIYSFKAPANTVIGSWKPYTFPGTVVLAVILLMVATVLVFLGRRIKNKVPVLHPGRVLRIVLITFWAILILLFLSVDVITGATRSGTGPILPITLACAAVTFIYLFYIYRHEGILLALGNGFAGAAAGPMVFEFPFDMIVISQLKAPATFLVAYFAPLDITVLLTLSFLLFSRHVFITRYSLYALGAMFLVFAVWALLGFAYPSNPVSFALNAISKILGFTAVVFLFSRDSNAPTKAKSNG